MDYIIGIAFAAMAFYFIYRSKMIGAQGIHKAWFMGAFVLKIVAAFVLLFLYRPSAVPREEADIFRFYDDIQVVWDSVGTHPDVYWSMMTGIGDDSKDIKAYAQKMNNWDNPESQKFISNNTFYLRILMLLNAISFGSYWGLLVLLIFLSYLGLFWFFRFFYHRLPQFKWLLFGIIFFFPSVVLWSSGVLKEGLLVFFVGLILNCGGFALKGRQPYYRIPVLLLSVGVIFFIKPFLAAVLIMLIPPFILLHFLPKQRALILYFVFVFAAFSMASESAKFMNKGVFEMIIQKQELFYDLAQKEHANSLISAPDLYPNSISFATALPLAWVNSMFRPLPFEAHGAMAWAMFLENLILIGFLLLVILFPVEKIAQKNIFWFSLMAALSIFAIIGYTTPILGAVSRYRIIAILFLMMAYVQLIDFEKIQERLGWK